MSDKKEKLREAIVNYCMEIIKQRGEIFFEELFELVRQKYQEIKDFRMWGGLHIRKHIEQRGVLVYPTTRDGKKGTLYTLKGKRLKKKCRVCGREIPHRGFIFCSEECYKELERIANFFIPIPEIYKYDWEELKEKFGWD